MSAVAEELERIHGFRTEAPRRVDLPDGEHLFVRQLSAGDTLLLTEDDPASGLKVLALSLATETGERLFTAANLDDGVTLVSGWPPEYLAPINAVLAAVNHGDLVEVARRD